MTITTTAFADAVKAAMTKQGVAEMSVVALEHPIGGRNDAETKQLVDSAFANIMKAATQWQPAK